jgi:orotidine-5'-phosphate decarboxylase
VSAARDALCLALDVADADAAVAWVARTCGAVATYKIGLELFTSEGPSVVDRIRRAGAERVFLDLKLHDIPNTVAGAVRSLSRLGVDDLTVHVAGGRAMLEAARAAAGSMRLLGVTVLTSLDAVALAEVGEGGAEPADVVCLRARLAAACGLGGVVCSPVEVGRVREVVGPGLRLVTPGIRNLSDAAGDQRRTLTPAEARRAGADLLVIGRPVLSAADPEAALQAIVRDIEGVDDGR